MDLPVHRLHLPDEEPDVDERPLDLVVRAEDEFAVGLCGRCGQGHRDQDCPIVVPHLLKADVL